MSEPVNLTPAQAAAAEGDRAALVGYLTGLTTEGVAALVANLANYCQVLEDHLDDQPQDGDPTLEGLILAALAHD